MKAKSLGELGDDRSPVRGTHEVLGCLHDAPTGTDAHGEELVDGVDLDPHADAAGLERSFEATPLPGPPDDEAESDEPETLEGREPEDRRGGRRLRRAQPTTARSWRVRYAPRRSDSASSGKSPA